MKQRALAVVLAVLLAASAFALVTAQHRSRALFIELERAQAQSKSLDAEGNRLRIELARAAQPAAVELAARGIGLVPIESKRTIFLPAPQGAGTCGSAVKRAPECVEAR